MEGKVVARTLARLAGSAGLDRFTRDILMFVWEQIEVVFDGLGFCLSEEGDLLGQWRGYADNAAGYSIGFSV